MMCLKKKKKTDTWQAENVVLDATWQKDNNVFCFNVYIDMQRIAPIHYKLATKNLVKTF